MRTTVRIYNRISALCILLCFAAVAKCFVVTPLPTQSQLPVGNVHCIYQDTEGYMWYGTKGGGLCRDNGYQILRIAGNDIICITEDKAGKIWFGTYEGLFYIDKRDYKVKATPYNGETSALLCDSHGRLWASVSGTIYCLDAYTHKVILEEKRPKENVATFYENSQKNIWILFWHNKIWRSVNGKHPEPFLTHISIEPSRIMEDRKRNGYWIGTWRDGVQFMDGKTFSLTPYPVTFSRKEQGQILDMKVDLRHNLIYTSTTDNLYIYHITDNTLKSVNTSTFMSANKKILDGMWLDGNYNLWIGGFIPTTFILSPTSVPVQRYAISEVTRQTGYPLIADRCVKDNNLLWISQGRIGLMLYNSNTQSLRTISGITSKSKIIEKRQRQAGIWCADGRRLLAVTSDDLLQTTVHHVASFDSEIQMIRDFGAYLLVSTSTGLYRFSTSLSSVDSKTSIHSIFRCRYPITMAAADVDGRVFFLVRGKGLYRLPVDGKPQLICSDKYRITCMDICSDGTLWTGTENGKIFTLHPGGQHLTFQEKYSSANHSAIIDIQTDYLRHIWVMSDQSVREINPTNGNTRTFHCQDLAIRVSNFYKLERAGQKIVGIGAADAYLEITPSLALNQTSAKTHPIIVSSYKTGDSLTVVPHDAKQIVIPANSSSLILNVTTNRQLGADKITFAYKTEEHSRWTYLPQGTNSIYLNNIEAGNSMLLLTSTDEYGRWSGIETTISIYHIPHWWQTTWARILFVLTAIALLYLLRALNKRSWGQTK